MAGGEFTSADRLAIDTCIRKNEQLSRVEFSVYVGQAEGDPREFATRLHNTLVAPARSIMIMVDPTARAIEVLTGSWVRSRLSDEEVSLAIQAMKSFFADGDITGGIQRGISMLAEHARANA